MTIELNLQFQKAIDHLEKEEDHLFITGNAGTGKSTLLSYFLKITNKKVVVLAPTGVAALNVGGETIHSFFRFHPGITVEEARKKGSAVKRNAFYKEIELLVIDEISMVRADLLDAIDAFLQGALRKKVPFGGIRMIFIGDLYQLPPVLRGEEKEYFSQFYKTPYFFSANVMGEANFTFLELEKIYRQKDPLFIEKLNSIRKNCLTDEDLHFFNKRAEIALPSDDDYIYLTTTNKAADLINREKLAKLPGSFKTFEAEISGDFKSSNSPTDPNLSLKKGAQVMFLTNQPVGLWVNGTIGKVEEIKDDEICVCIDENSVWVKRHDWTLYHYILSKETKSLTKEKIGSFCQFPLRLAWGITIHKSQGKSFEKVIIDLGAGSFAHGQTYVALSRCRSFDGMILKKPLKRGHVLTDFQVVNFLTKWQYEIAKKNHSIEEKIEIIKKAIEEKKELEIVYLKATDEKSRRRIKPTFVGTLEYKNRSYLGIQAFCLKRKENRIFRVDRILEICT